MQSFRTSATQRPLPPLTPPRPLPPTRSPKPSILLSTLPHSESAPLPGDAGVSLSSVVDVGEQCQDRREQWRAWLRIAAVAVLLSGFASVFSCIVCALYLSPVNDPLVHIKDLPVGIIVGDVLPPELQMMGVNTTLGQLLASTLLSAPQTKHLYDWRIHTNVSYEEARQRVREDAIFAYIYFPPNYTSTFLLHFMGAAPGAPLCPYDNPVVVVLDETKQYTTARILATALNITFRAMSSSVAQMLMAGVVQEGNKTYALPPGAGASATYGLRADPIYATYDTPRRIEHYGWYFIAYIAFVVVWLAMLLATNVTALAFPRTAVKAFWQLCLLRLGTLAWVALVTSLVLAGFVSNSYGYPLANGYGALFGTFLLASLAMGGIVAMLHAWLDQAGLVAAVFLLILQITTCDGIYSVWTLPPGFRGVSQVFPIYHAARLQRRAAFDTLHEGLAKHVLVQLAWMAAGFGAAVPGWYLGAGLRLMHSVLPPRVEGGCSKGAQAEEVK
eukprot:m51a1_g7035 hypothetical protein (501) ;mRNA; r:91708-93466